MADRPHRPRQAEVPLPPMPAAWAGQAAAGPRPGPRPPSIRYPAAVMSPPAQMPPAPRPVSPIPYPGLPPASFPAGAVIAPGGPGEPQLSSRSAVVAGLLQVFLGFFGAGRFYTGHVGLAVAQLVSFWFVLGLVSVAPGAIFFLVIYVLVWPLTDGIVLLAGNGRDREGRPLR